MSLSIQDIRSIAKYYPELRRDPRFKYALTIIRTVNSLQEFYDEIQKHTGRILHITINGWRKSSTLSTENVTPNEHVDVFLTIRNTDRISPYAFYNCLNLQKVVIKEPITDIGMSTFQQCKMLKEVVLPDTVTSIGIGAFLSCINLQRIYLGTSLRRIGIGAFSRCSNLKYIFLPDSITNIGVQAFLRSGLEEISIPNTLYYRFPANVIVTRRETNTNTREDTLRF